MRNTTSFMRKSKPTIISLFILSLILVPTLHAQEKITIAGSINVFPVVRQASLTFKSTHPGVEISVSGGGSSIGIKSVGNNEIDIGNASRPINYKEKEQFPNLIPYKLGTDGVTIIANKLNSITSISKKQVQDIFTGKITNWKDIGGRNVPIILISRDKVYGEFDLFLEYFDLEAKEIGEGHDATMVFKVKGEDNFSTTEAIQIGSNKDAIAKVMTQLNGISYVSIGTAYSIASKGGRITLLELDGVKATVGNVENGSYPMHYPLNVITNGEPHGAVKEFIDFLLSEVGQNIVKSLDYISVKPTS